MFLRFAQIFHHVPQISKIKFVNWKHNFSTSPIGILGVPLSKGQPKSGVDQAPDVLRSYGLIKQLQDLGLDVKDYGNVKFNYMADATIQSVFGKLKYPLEVGAACQKISEAVKEVLLEKRKCVTLGGDHSLGIGSVHGHSQVHDVCVLWVDAHADINTSLTSVSGHMHGMPLAFLIKELAKYQPTIGGFEWLKPCISKRNVAFIGLRDIDPLEKLILMKEDILHFTMRDVDKLGIFKVINRALEAINPTGKLSLHVSFDIDSIDTSITPCTGTPVHGGLTIRESLCLAEEICNLDSFHALDIVEVNPELGNRDQLENTLGVAALVTKAFLGYARHGNLPHNVHEIPIL